MVDPPDAEGLVVGRTAARGKHVLGRNGGAHQVHLLQPAVEDGIDAVARLQATRHGKPVAHHGFERTATFGPAAAAQRERILALTLRVGPCQVQADEAAGHRCVGVGQGDLCVHHHVELDLGHSRDGRQARAQVHRRTLDAGEHVGQAVVAIETVARALQRLVHREHAHETGHADGHHHRDGDHLRAQALEVAPEFGVQGLHGGVTTSGWPRPPCAR